MENGKEEKIEVDKPVKPKAWRVLRQDIVAKFLAHHFKADPPTFGTRLMHVEQLDSMWAYQEIGYWKMLRDPDLRKAFARFIERDLMAYCKGAAKVEVTSQLTTDLVKVTKDLCDLSCERIEDAYLSLEDCDLDFSDVSLKAKGSVKGDSTIHLPFSRKEIKGTMEPPPNFRIWLETSVVKAKGDEWEPDLQTWNYLQELMGYVIYPKNPSQLSWFLLGEGANGKSVFCDALQAMLGPQYCSAYSLKDLSDNRFNVPGLIGKRANVNTEEPGKFLNGSMFKALVSQDYVMGEYKYGGTIRFRNRAKLIMSCNEYPTFENMNHSMRRRIQIIKFPRKFDPKDQDKTLSDKLALEAPAILGWALAGLKRLHDNDFVFTRTDSMEEAKVELDEESSNAIRFWNDCCKLPDAPLTDDEKKEWFMPTTALHRAYGRWCEANGYKGSFSRENFSKNVTPYAGPVVQFGKDRERGRFVKMKGEGLVHIDWKKKEDEPF